MFIDNPVILAPMAGVTDRVFRELVYQLAPGLAYTEMISAMALLYANPRTFRMLELEEYRPLTAQLFGSDPVVMSKAAQVIESQFAPTFIDINMGCPTPKIVSNGDGSALMRTPDLAARIVAAVAEGVTTPVTVKIRAGWDEESINAPQFARLMVQAGAQAITVHGRTRSQFYSGSADWGIIQEVAKAVNVPVIGNGDIADLVTAKDRLSTTGCAGIMVGRGALGNPWLIARARQQAESVEVQQTPTHQDRVEMAIHHLEQAVNVLGEDTAVPQMRKHIAWYLKGIPGSAEVKVQAQVMKSATEVKNVLTRFCAQLT